MSVISYPLTISWLTLAFIPCLDFFNNFQTDLAAFVWVHKIQISTSSETKTNKT